MVKRSLGPAFEEYKKARTLIESLIPHRVELESLGSDASPAQQMELLGVRERIVSAISAAKDYGALMAKASEEEENSKLFTNADQKFIEKVTGTRLSAQDWTVQEDASVFPSPILKQRLEHLNEVVCMYKETGRRFILNEFLLDILIREEFKNALRIYPEYEYSVSAQSDTAELFQLSGVADYTVGRRDRTTNFRSKVPPKELHLIAAEAKRDFPDESFWQCVAQTAALYKSRKDAGKTVCKVWGFVSNATFWTFVHIDQSGQLHATQPLTLPVGGSYDEGKVLAIYRHLHFIVKTAFEASPPPSPEEPSRQRPSGAGQSRGRDTASSCPS